MNIYHYPITDGVVQKYVIASGTDQIILDLESAKKVVIALNHWIDGDDVYLQTKAIGTSMLEKAYPTIKAMDEIKKAQIP